MSEIKETKNILYRVEKDFPVNGVNFIDLTPTLTENNHFFEVSEALKELIYYFKKVIWLNLKIKIVSILHK